jgi:hypothetical protein
MLMKVQILEVPLGVSMAYGLAVALPPCLVSLILPNKAEKSI